MQREAIFQKLREKQPQSIMTLWKRYGVVIIAAIHILLQHDGDAAVSQWPSRIDVHTIYKYILFMRVGDVGGIEGGMLSGFFSASTRAVHTYACERGVGSHAWMLVRLADRDADADGSRKARFVCQLV